MEPQRSLKGNETKLQLSIISFNKVPELNRYLYRLLVEQTGVLGENNFVFFISLEIYKSFIYLQKSNLK